MDASKSNQLRPYIIAELGLNHEGDIGLCKEMVKKAKEAGCNAVKLQSLDYNDTNIKKNLATVTETQKYGKITVGDLLKKLLLSDTEHKIFADYCKEQGIDFISTVFGFRHIDLLDKVGVDKYKIASQDLIHLKLLEEVAKKQKPMVVSVGMGAIGEIETAIKTIRKFNSEELSILYCSAQYPPEDSEVNLKRIITLKDIFDLKIGFSDHTLGITSAIIATTLGAEVIEKHFTYDKSAEGWDHAISADYNEMKKLCAETRRVQLLLGESCWNITESELMQREKMRRSIVTKVKLKAGDVITEDNIDFKRPGSGIKPDKMEYILGRTIIRDIEPDELIQWKDLK